MTPAERRRIPVLIVLYSQEQWTGEKRMTDAQRQELLAWGARHPANQQLIDEFSDIHHVLRELLKQ